METLPETVKEVAMGVWLCTRCDSFTSHPELLCPHEWKKEEAQ